MSNVYAVQPCTEHTDRLLVRTKSTDLRDIRTFEQ